MAILRLSCFCITLLLFFTNGEGDKTEKRLLLNDPDVAVRLAHLEQQNQILTDLVNRLNSTVLDLEKRLHTTGKGATYIRWGRTVCDSMDTELVYRGYTAGQRYYYTQAPNNHGGPSDFLCLPDNPQISNQSYTLIDSLLFGTEYERNEFSSNSNSANEDAPCALCRKTTPSAVVMIPGRQTCYWTLEYRGYLGSGHYTENASSYICVDQNPEYIPSGHANVNGRLLYLVGYKCGPLPCPPYVDQRKAECVVCSK